MKFAKAILWFQLVLGLIGGYVAFTYVHWGAMSAAWAYRLRINYEQMQRSPGFQDPPAIHDQSLHKILEDFEASGHARADVAGYWLFTCGALVVLAALVLWRLRGVRNMQA